jgi:ATP-dependent Clp protease adapter protein ClpS
MATTAPVELERPTSDEDVEPDVPWIVIVWNDPVNLMSYVVYVFQKLFGYSREKATKLMLDVHHRGRRSCPPVRRRRASSTSRACTRTGCGRRCRRTGEGAPSGAALVRRLCRAALGR